MATKDDIRRAQEAFRLKMEKQGVVSFGGQYMPEKDIISLRNLGKPREHIEGSYMTPVRQHLREISKGGVHFKTKVRGHKRTIN